MSKRFLILIIAFLFTTSAVYAQATCPPSVLLALARSGSACFDLEPNQACIGNGTVESQLFSTSQAELPPFAAPGDKITAVALRDVHTQSIDEGISTAIIYTQANLTDAEERGVALFLFGDTRLQNQVEPLLEITAFAIGSLNIRQTPDDDAHIITTLAVNKAVIANGRSDDGRWLRVHIPNSNDLGWAALDVLNPEGNVLNLPVVALDTPVYRPFEVLTLTTASASACDGALPAGLLLQTPNFTPVILQINGIQINLSGTFFMQAESKLTVYALDGEATLTLGAESVYLPAGTQGQSPLNSENIAQSLPSAVEPYELAALSALPLNNLPSRAQIAAPLTVEQIAAKTAEHIAALTQAAQPVVVNPVADTTCRRVSKRDTTLWGGPGIFYEAVNEISAGTTLSPVLQTTDPNGAVWWQLRNSNWIQADQAIQTGECTEIPFTEVVAPPLTNHLSLETCETTNGPLRAGQSVEIEFIPPAWDNYGEARDAVTIDPGEITIGSQTYRPYASEPIRLGTVGERYIREFYITWTALPGTHRIVADRLHYTPICTVTVPVG